MTALGTESEVANQDRKLSDVGSVVTSYLAKDRRHAIKCSGLLTHIEEVLQANAGTGKCFEVLSTMDNRRVILIRWNVVARKAE